MVSNISHQNMSWCLSSGAYPIRQTQCLPETSVSKHSETVGQELSEEVLGGINCAGRTGIIINKSKQRGCCWNWMSLGLWEFGSRSTILENLIFLCNFHGALQTSEGWREVNGRSQSVPSSGEPGWVRSSQPVLVAQREPQSFSNSDPTCSKTFVPWHNEITLFLWVIALGCTRKS